MNEGNMPESICDDGSIAMDSATHYLWLNQIVKAVDAAWYAPGEIARCWDFDNSEPKESPEHSCGNLELFIVQEIYESDGLSTNWVASAVADLLLVQQVIDGLLCGGGR